MYSLGYLDFAGMQEFVGAVARALKPGGRFLNDTGMAAESILPGRTERDWFQVEDIWMAVENRYLSGESRLETEAVLVRNGKIETRQWWHWVYTVAEIRRLLAGAGLTTEELYGAFDRRPFKLGCERLLIVARKA